MSIFIFAAQQIFSPIKRLTCITSVDVSDQHIRIKYRTSNWTVLFNNFGSPLFFVAVDFTFSILVTALEIPRDASNLQI